MKRACLAMLALLMAVLCSACNKKACERFCDCDDLGYNMSFSLDVDDDDSVSPSDHDCYEACRDELKGAGPPCRTAFRSAARCLDRTGCDEDDCLDELAEAEVNCAILF